MVAIYIENVVKKATNVTVNSDLFRKGKVYKRSFLGDKYREF